MTVTEFILAVGSQSDVQIQIQISRSQSRQTDRQTDRQIDRANWKRAAGKNIYKICNSKFAKYLDC